MYLPAKLYNIEIRSNTCNPLLLYRGVGDMKRHYYGSHAVTISSMSCDHILHMSCDHILHMCHEYLII